MTKLRIKLDGISIDKCAYKKNEQHQKNCGDGSDVVGIQRKDKHQLFFDVVDDCGEHKGYLLFNETCNEVELELNNCGDLKVKDIKNNCCTENPVFSWSRNIDHECDKPYCTDVRLDKIICKIRELEREVECIRRGD